MEGSAAQAWSQMDLTHILNGAAATSLLRQQMSHTLTEPQFPHQPHVERVPASWRRCED